MGAIIGAVAGHAVDKVKAQESGAGSSSFAGHGPDARQVAFTTAVIVLSAKMAKADGQVTADEIDLIDAWSAAVQDWISDTQDALERVRVSETRGVSQSKDSKSKDWISDTQDALESVRKHGGTPPLTFLPTYSLPAIAFPPAYNLPTCLPTYL